MGVSKAGIWAVGLGHGYVIAQRCWLYVWLAGVFGLFLVHKPLSLTPPSPPPLRRTPPPHPRAQDVPHGGHVYCSRRRSCRARGPPWCPPTPDLRRCLFLMGSVRACRPHWTTRGTPLRRARAPVAQGQGPRPERGRHLLHEAAARQELQGGPRAGRHGAAAGGGQGRPAPHAARLEGLHVQPSDEELQHVLRALRAGPGPRSRPRRARARRGTGPLPSPSSGPSASGARRPCPSEVVVRRSPADPRPPLRAPRHTTPRVLCSPQVLHAPPAPPVHVLTPAGRVPRARGPSGSGRTMVAPLYPPRPSPSPDNTVALQATEHAPPPPTHTHIVRRQGQRLWPR